MPSKEWEYFIENFFGDPYLMWHDGIDIASVTRLNEEEKIRAEDMLIREMQKGNHYAVMGLRSLHSKKATRIMKRMLDGKLNSYLKLEIFIALNEIENTTKYVQGIIEILDDRDNEDWNIKINAAIALRKYKNPEVVDALFRAMRYPEYLVRYHAAESLLAIHGYIPDISLYDDILSEIVWSEEDGIPWDVCKKHIESSIQLMRERISRPPPHGWNQNFTKYLI